MKGSDWEKPVENFFLKSRTWFKNHGGMKQSWRKRNKQWVSRTGKRDEALTQGYIFKRLGPVRFFYVFEVLQSRLHLFDQKYCKNSYIYKYYYNSNVLIISFKSNLFLWWLKLNFQQPLLSWHDPSEIIVIYFAAQEPPVIIHVEISCAA